MHGFLINQDAVILHGNGMKGVYNNVPPITRSMAASKCFNSMNLERCRAAINAASLQTFAMSAPIKNSDCLYCFKVIFGILR